MYLRAGLIIALGLGACSGALHAEQPLFDDQGYRIARYRAPVPHAPPGVHRIAPAAVTGLRPDRDAVLLDVMPAEGGRRRDDGQWLLAVPRMSIAGAHWLPDTGRGSLTQPVAAWFQAGVAKLMRGRKDSMIVVFCLADCWMSWNAAKRLRELGYTDVWWLAEGTDGWSELGLPLRRVSPER